MAPDRNVWGGEVAAIIRSFIVFAHLQNMKSSNFVSHLLFILISLCVCVFCMSLSASICAWAMLYPCSILGFIIINVSVFFFSCNEWPCRKWTNFGFGFQFWLIICFWGNGCWFVLGLTSDIFHRFWEMSAIGITVSFF